MMKSIHVLFVDTHKALVLLYLLFCFVLQSIAQDSDVVFEKLTIRDGISHSNVYSIIQDDLGYIWFGTQDGLNRYDGQNISIFRYDTSNPNSISTGNFGKIYQDRSGNFWFGTFGGGIDWYNPKTNTLKNFSYNPNDSLSISNNQVLFIFEDSEGTIWIGTPDGGLNKFNQNNETFNRFQHSTSNPSSLSHNRAKCMCETPDGTLWVGTAKGLNKFNKETGTFLHYSHNPANNNSLSGNVVQNMIANPDGSIWIVLRDGGLNKFDPSTETFTRYTHDPKNPNSISDNQADCILRDSRNQIWVGTYDGGLNRFDPETKSFTRYKHNPSNNESLSSNRIEYLFEDNAQILWIGTRGGGINKLDLKPRKFNNITHNPSYPNSLPQQTIMSITSDKKGNIWIGSDGGGLTKYNPNTKSYTHFVNQPNNTNSLSNNRVWSLRFDSDSILWIGTYQGGLNRLEHKNGRYIFSRFQNNPKDSESISQNQINSILEDKNGNLWIATANGLNQLIKTDSPDRYKFKSFFHSRIDSQTFADNYINSILHDSKGRLWIGSYQGGLIEFDTETEKFIPHIPHGADEESFTKRLRLLAIFEDSKENLWIGTESSGLLLLDYENDKYIPHPNNDQLIRNMVLNIIEDDIGNLWISSTRGLSRYSLIDGSFNTYTISDGLESDGFNRNAAHKTSDGMLYFGSNSGLTNFIPSEVTNNPHVPKVTITDFKVLNQSIWSKILSPYVSTLNQDGEIVLYRKDYFFSVHFASLDFTNPSKNQYRYKLEGFNNEWIEIGNNTSATFTNLNHGTYVFKVMGSNNDNIWNENPTELTIRIIPPLWKRTWFLLLEGFLFALLVFTYIRLRTRKLILDKRVLEEKVAERTLEIRAQKEEIETTLEKLKSTQTQLIQSEKMASVGILTSGIAHEINNPLNFIQGGVNAVEDYVDENLKDHFDNIAPLLEMINEGVNRTSQIVRSLNRFSKNTDTSVEKCDIHRIIDNCLQVLHNQLENKVKIHKNYNDPAPQILGNEAKLHQVFISLLINALQAIESIGEISLSTQIRGNSVTITIADTGCGISEENIARIADPFFTTKDPGKGVGLGLSIVYSIIQEHKGSIHFDSELEKGTTVKIILPLND